MKLAQHNKINTTETSRNTTKLAQHNRNKPQPKLAQHNRNKPQHDEISTTQQKQPATQQNYHNM